MKQPIGSCDLCENPNKAYARYYSYFEARWIKVCDHHANQHPCIWCGDYNTRANHDSFYQDLLLKPTDSPALRRVKLERHAMLTGRMPRNE